MTLHTSILSIRSDFKTKLDDLEKTVSDNRSAIEDCGEKLTHLEQVIQSRRSVPVDSERSQLAFDCNALREKARPVNRPKAVSAPMQQQPNVRNYVLFHESPMLSQIKEFVICSSTEKGNETPDEPLPQIACDFDQDNGTTIDNDLTEPQNDPRFLMVQNFQARDFVQGKKQGEERRRSSPPPLSPCLIEEAFLKKEPLSIRKNDRSGRIEVPANLNSLSKVKDFNDFQQLLKNLRSTLSFQETTESQKLVSLFESFESKVDQVQRRTKKLKDKIEGFSSFLRQEIHKRKPINSTSTKNGRVSKDQINGVEPQTHCLEQWVVTLCQLESEITFFQNKYSVINSELFPDRSDDTVNLDKRLSHIESQYRNVYAQVKVHFNNLR